MLSAYLRSCGIVRYMKKPQEKEKVRLTVELPLSLWALASHVAIDERSSIKKLVVEALEDLVAKKRKEGKGGKS